MVNKILSLRVFPDEHGQINISLQDVNGSILSVSQFTLYANTAKGRRPSFVDALRPGEAEPLYNYYQRAGSISHNQFSIKEFDRVTADRIRLDFYHKHFPQCEDAAAIAYIGSCLNVYYHSRHCSDAKKQRASLEKELRMALRSYPNLPFTKKQRSKANLFLFSPILYTLTMSMRGK